MTEGIMRDGGGQAGEAFAETEVVALAAAEVYRGRTAVLATRHGKEAAIAPAFRAALGLELAVPEGLDTDSLGTFTGEVPRTGSMRDAALRKARMGLEATGLSLAVASEGSFGPHPALPFLAVARELLVFIDTERGLEICEEQVSEHTNFAVLEVGPNADLESFLSRIGFPRHALVVRAGDRLVKGVTSRAYLDRLLGMGGPVRLETDMRAHLNPTRMASIARLAERLARRVATPCPACGTPGFGITRSLRGLPCADCGTPTERVATRVQTCARCSTQRLLPRSDGRLHATPAECPECNP